jgi:hypothetical protein
VNVGPPVATIEGAIVVMVGITPIPDSGTSIFPTPGFENVISRVAVSTPGSEAVNVMPNAHEVNVASENPAPRLQGGVGGLTADEGAPSLKSAELADGRMAMLVTFSVVDPLPVLVSVPSASEAAPFGMLPKLIGLGKHEPTEQKPRKALLCWTEKLGTGPFTCPEIKKVGSGSVAVSLSVTVTLADREPGAALPGGLNCMPNQQDPPGAMAVAAPVGAKAQIADAGGAGAFGVPVGATILKSPGFAPPMVADPADRASTAPPLTLQGPTPKVGKTQLLN